MPKAWFADIDQGQIYIFEVGTMYETFFIYGSHANRSTIKALTWNQAMGKRVSIKIFNINFRELAVYVGPDTLCNSSLGKVKSDETVVNIRRYVLYSG